MTKNVEEKIVQRENVADDVAKMKADPPEADRTLLDDKELGYQEDGSCTTRVSEWRRT